MDRHSFVSRMPPGLAAAVGLPDHRRVAYWRPDPAFGTAITGYNGYGELEDDERVDWFLPADVMLCVTTADAGPIAVTIGRREFPRVPRVAVYGPNSRAMRVIAHGGVNIGIGVSPTGWARLARRPVADTHNIVVPLGDLLGKGLTEELTGMLDAVEDPAAIPRALDDIFAPRLATRHPDEPLIEAIGAMLRDTQGVEIGVAAARIGIPAHALRRVSLRYFGMTPKLLARRARFLRSFLKLFRTPEATDYSVIDPSYHDASHFLRDANSFLGTTPRRFLAQATPFLDASVTIRAAVLGAPTQALHGAPAASPEPAAPPSPDAEPSPRAAE